jgi:hypothetical protein
MPEAATPDTQFRSRSRRRRREPKVSEFTPRLFGGAVAVGCLGSALALAYHYPLGAGPAMAGVLLTVLLARYFWMLWPGWMLAFVPLLGFAPWTGWMMVEEVDLLLLASAAGGYLALSGPHHHKPPAPVPVWRRELRWRLTTLTLLGLFLASSLVASLHGLLEAGGWKPNWFQGYLEGGAALRAAKPALYLLLMMPLWQRVARRSPQTITPSVAAGLAGALWVVCLGALYERMAYTGLTDFSQDYRTTSVFWEMHVGGAALDGALILLMPFALLAVLRRRQGLGFGLAVALLMLSFYVVLTTFSRALQVAVLVALPMCAGLWIAQQRRAVRGARDPASNWLPGQVLPDDTARPLLPVRGGIALLLLVLTGAGVVALLFPTSGYRGLLAVCGTLIALLAQPPAHASSRSQRIFSSGLGLVMALPLVGLAALLAGMVDKAAYVIYALAWGVAMVLARLASQGKAPWPSALGDALRAGAWFTVLGCTAVVAWSWGGMGAAQAAWPLGVLALAWPLSQGGLLGNLLGQMSWRSRVGAMAAVILAAAVVATFGGGAYLGSRLATTGADFQGRLHHWNRTLAILAADNNWLMGAGAGRFVGAFALNAPRDEQTGDFRASRAGARPNVVAISGRHTMGNGEILRLSQRIDDAPAGLKLRYSSRNENTPELFVEVCQKHLLYGDTCLTKVVNLPDSPEAWQSGELLIGGNGELAERGWLRRSLVFSIAIASRGDVVRLSDLSLTGANGQELLKNGRFDDGLSRWFITSDKHHLPWHAKNLPLHLAFEQGIVGLLLGGGLLALGLGRLLLGSGRDHALTPALAASLVGFVLVGVFDSLIDAPRIAFIFFTLLAISLGLRAPPPVAPPLTRFRR